MLEEFIYPPICLLLFSFIYSKVDDVFVTELKPQLMEFTIKKTGFYILEVVYAHPSKLNPARSYPSTIFDYNYDPKRHFIFASHFENRLTRSIGQIHRVTFLSKNLYNATLYQVRQQFFMDGSFLKYAEVNKLFTHERQADYIALPAKVAKHTQQLVDHAYRSFFALLKAKKENPEINAKIPKYLDKTKGRQVTHYEKGALSFVKQGFIKLSGLDFYIKTKLTKNQVAFVRLVPRGNHIVVEIGYERYIPKPKTKTGRIAGLDLGLNNLATLTSNVASPIIVNGRPLKSINQFYNKHKAVEDSKLDLLV